MKQTKKKFVLALDIGGTKIAAGIVNNRGKILFKYVEPTNPRASSRIFLNNLKRVIKHTIKAAGFQLVKIRPLRRSATPMRQRGESESVASGQIRVDSRVTGIGIGAPGSLDIKQGKIIFAPNLPKIKNFQIVKPLKAIFKLPVILENDANAAALGEWMFGAGRKTKNLIYLTVSTGIGGGIIINNQLYRGLNNAGELGHIIINHRGPKCGCGNYGCLEIFASGAAITKKARRAPKNSLIWRFARKRKEPIDAKLVFRTARSGDGFARKIISDSLTALGIGLVNIIHTFHPDKIILGGGIMGNERFILPFLRKFVQKKVMLGFFVQSGPSPKNGRRASGGKEYIKIEKAKLGENSGLIGLMVAVIKHLKINR